LGIKKDLVIDKKVESFIILSLKKPNLMINLNHIYQINSKSSDNKETITNNYEIKYLEKTDLKRINQGSFFIINNKKNISDKDRNKKEEDIKELNEISGTKKSDNNQKYDEKEYKKVYEIYSQNIEIIPELFKKKEKISIEKINEQNIEINQFDIQIFRIKKDTLIRAFNEEFSILNDKNNIKKRVEMIENKREIDKNQTIDISLDTEKNLDESIRIKKEEIENKNLISSLSLNTTEIGIQTEVKKRVISNLEHSENTQEKSIIIRTKEKIKKIKNPLISKIIIRQRFLQWKNNCKCINIMEHQESFIIYNKTNKEISTVMENKEQRFPEHKIKLFKETKDNFTIEKKHSNI
jgi:hypothetical protein